MARYASQVIPRISTHSIKASQISWFAGIRSAIVPSTFHKPAGVVLGRMERKKIVEVAIRILVGLVAGEEGV